MKTGEGTIGSSRTWYSIPVSLIRIHLSLFASLGTWQDPPRKDIELIESLSVHSLILDLGIPEREVAIVIINEKRAALGDLLKDGDDVRLFPSIGGG